MDKAVQLAGLPPTIGIKGLEKVPHEIIAVIYDMLVSGFAPYRIAVHIYQRRNIDLDPQAIDAYFLRIPEEELLPKTAFARHMRQANFVVDPLEQMRKVLRLIEERLGRELEVEDMAGGKDLNPRVDRQIERYWQKLGEYRRLTLDPNFSPVGARNEDAPTLGELFKMHELIEGHATTNE